MNKRFLFFENFKSIADKLPDDMRLKFYDALLNYVFEGVEPEDDVISALITAIKPSLDKEDNRGGNHNPTGLNQYSEVKTGQKKVKNNFEQVKNGQSGQSFLETGNRKQETEEKEKNNLKVIQKEKTKVFKKPTLEEITTYCKEKNMAVNPQTFYEYFEAGNWVDSKGQKVRNWKQKLITWNNKQPPDRGIKPLMSKADAVYQQGVEASKAFIQRELEKQKKENVLC